MWQVGFGQTICTPLRPKCGECQLAERSLCPSATSALPPGGVVRRIRAKKGDEVTVVRGEEEREKLRLPPLLEESRAGTPPVLDDVAGLHDDVAFGHWSTAGLKMEVKEEVPSGEMRIWSQETVVATSSDVKAELEPSMPGGVGAVRGAPQMSVADVAVVKVEC